MVPALVKLLLPSGYLTDASSLGELAVVDEADRVWKLTCGRFSRLILWSGRVEGAMVCGICCPKARDDKTPRLAGFLLNAVWSFARDWFGVESVKGDGGWKGRQ
jgi:hypothetical protein